MDDNPAEREEPCRDADCSIQRTARQVDDEDELERQDEDEFELEPYVPYLGFIFYSFPVFSFTIPFGGQLKLFGYDFI